MSADITLLNLNLLYVRYLDTVDRELHLPLGCLYLTRALEQAGYTVDFRDYQLTQASEPFSTDAILRFLEGAAPVVGFSCMANLLPFAILAMKEYKKQHPEATLILGGVGSKAVEEQILERFPWIDVIAVGEGERTGPELLAAIRRGDDLTRVAGLVVRGRDGRIVRTPMRERVPDLDVIPFPAFEHIDLKQYRGYGLMSSRGCPYPCTFCSVAPVWDHASTFRSIGNIVDEMQMLHEKAGVKMFLFQDEYFVSKKARVMEFCDALSRSGLKVMWKSFGRVDLTDREMMEAMAATGCVELRFGIESGCDRILQLVKKGFSAEQAIARVSEAVGIFPRVDAFYIWGFPFETLDDFHQTVFQMVSLRMLGARILPSMLCLLPQTELYQAYAGKAKLEFCPELFPEYMITGHEISTLSKFEIAPQHRPIYEFIQAHPDLFPGFFHIDLAGNILPKLAVLKKFGFYPDTLDAAAPESCGAHSPESAATRACPV